MKTPLLTILIAISIGSAASAAPSFTVTPLVPLDGSGTGAFANGLNSAGEVAGSTLTSNGTRAFQYSHGVSNDLGTVSGFPSSEAYGINDSGVIVGRLYLNANNESRGFIYTGGVMSAIGTLSGGTDSFLVDINETGMAVGRSDIPADPTDPFSIRIPRAIRYDSTTGTMLDLGSLGGARSSASAINEAGQIVGTADLAGNANNSHAFRYANGVMTDLGALGGPTAGSSARCINENGVAAGASQLVDGALIHPCIFMPDGQIIDIGTFVDTAGTPFDTGTATGINIHGDVVGTYADPGTSASRPFLYSGGQLYDPNTLLVAADSGWFINEMSAINDSGQITARASRVDVSGSRPVLLTPTTFTPPVPTPPPTPTPTVISKKWPAPMVAIAGKNKGRTSKDKLTLKGTASDAGGVLARVEVKVGKAAYKPAKGTTSWNFTARLKPGRNTLFIHAVDASGTTSPVVTATIIRK